MLIALAVLALVSALAMVPVDRTPLPSFGHQSASYESAVLAYDSLRAVEAPLVTAEGASLIYLHGHRTPRALVLLHGITNSPRQFRELAELFHARGYNVVVPRLPLHGLRAGDVDALRALTADKLRDYGDAAVNVASGLGDTVLVMGLSTGGLVTAWIAHHRRDVARVVVISPAIKLARLPAMLAGPTVNLADRIPNVTIRQRPDTTRRHAYFGVSTRALAETFRFGATIVGEAEAGPPVVSDLTVVTNGNDRTVDEGAALALADAWARHDSLSVVRYRFGAEEKLPHDLIDATQRCGAPDLVYPTLIALMEKTPATSTGAHGPCRAEPPALGP